MNLDDAQTNAAVTAEIALNVGKPQDLVPGKLVAVAKPNGMTVEQIDLQAYEDKYADRPRRAKGVQVLATVQSLIDWVNRHKTPETYITADEKGTTFKAVFNGHTPNSDAVSSLPGHGDFGAAYNCPLSDEWRRWIGKSQHDRDEKKGMGHAEFIQFIEDNMLDITQPDSAAMLVAIRSFEAKRDVQFKSAKRLDNGDVAFAYVEDTQQQTPAGHLSLPSKFEITIPVFQGGKLYAIDANLRYRVGPGGLVLFYELVRPHKSLEHAFNEVSEQIRTGTSVPMFAV